MLFLVVGTPWKRPRSSRLCCPDCGDGWFGGISSIRMATLRMRLRNSCGSESSASSTTLTKCSRFILHPLKIHGRSTSDERLPRGLRRDAGGCRFQVREPEREEHLRLRVVVQRLIRLARKPRKPRRRTRLFLLLALFHWPLDLRRKGRRDCQAPLKRAPS